VAAAIALIAAPAAAQVAPPLPALDHDAGLPLRASGARREGLPPPTPLDPAHTPLPWYAPRVLAYEEGQPIPPGYAVTQRRRRSLIVAGAALFGASWLTSALTAATVVAGTNRHRSEVAPLFAPFAGPWITVATSRDARLDDPDRRMNGVLLVVDGVAQLTGAALFLAGMVTREPVLTRTRQSFDTAALPEILVGGRAAALRWRF
jgi:hypothetical protein